MEKTDGELTQEEVKNYLTLQGERLITAKRPHWIVLLEPFFLIIFLALLFNLGALLVFAFFYHSIILFTLITLVITTIASSLLAKLWVDNYFHIYIVTTRKILKIRSRPMFTDTVDDVFLDQVRTTEIDIKTDNFIKKILNIGDVVIAFDRPSHDEEFILKDIKDPKKTGDLLCRELENMMYESPIWFEPRKKDHPFKVHDDIYPPQTTDRGP